MWHALEALQFVGDILELVFHWRVWLCAIAGLTVALLLMHLFPTYVGAWALFASSIAGVMLGLFWEWAR